MENQDIKWETWEEQPQENNEQPQVNWGEQSQEENIPTWGEQPQQEQPQQGWGEQPQQEQPQINWGEHSQEENIPTWGEQPQQNWDKQPQQEPEVNGWGEPPTPQNTDLHQNWDTDTSAPKEEKEIKDDFTDIAVEEWETKTSILGLLPKLKIEALLYQFNYDNKLATKEIIDIGFEKIDDDSRYKINYQPNTELANILGAIKSIGGNRGMKLQHSYLYKNEPKESTINIARGECAYNYIYFLQGNYNSGNVILDFSSLNGPSEQVIQTTPGVLLLLPGWVPYSITKNLSNTDMIAVAGRFTYPR